MDELVSVIMPSYNTAKYIGEAVRSVIDQTYKNWELIIVDDCSTDNTEEVVKPYRLNPQIHYIRNNENEGAAISRNRALKLAKGKWIAFLDSDDLWEPEKLEHQIQFMKKNGYFFSYSIYEEISEDGAPLNKIVSGPERISKRGMHRYCYPGCLTVMYDAESIGVIQIKDIKKNNDYAIWLQICKKTDCYLLAECLAKYRRRANSISRHGVMTMIGWHYRLWHEIEEKSCMFSLYYTVLNIFFGFTKRCRYVMKLK